MTDITITEADREAAQSIEWVQTTIDDNEAIARAFAAHRLSAIEQSAQIAEKHGTHWVAKDIRKMREG